MIPAAGTRFQRDAGIHDGPETLFKDIMRRNMQEVVMHMDYVGTICTLDGHVSVYQDGQGTV